MDPYLKKSQDIVDSMGKIRKTEKILANIQVIFCFIMFYIVLFKNIYILKLFILVPSVIISIINFTLTLKQKKLMNEILEISRKSEKILEAEK